MTTSLRNPFCTMSDLVDRGDRPARYGLPWTKDEFDTARNLFNGGKSLRDICCLMQRPPSGVASKLHNLNLLEIDTNTGAYYYLPKKGIIMAYEDNCAKNIIPAKAPNIEVKTFIGGEDAARMSDEQIFNKIASLEDQIAKIDKINAKPKKLQAARDKLVNDINALVEFVDARP